MCRTYGKSSTAQEIMNFETVDKFSQWLNLYWKRFDYFEYIDSSKPRNVLTFNTKDEFDDFYKKVKK